MNASTFDSIHSNWNIDNQLHNRINFVFKPFNTLEIKLGIRNRLIYGNSVSINPMYSDYVEEDYGWMQLSKNFIEGNSILLNSNIDRFSIKYHFNSFEMEFGRQRINWATTSVWNPSDLFNNASYFDFDYEEKPGSDALRLQYFLGPLSNVEFAIKLDHQNKKTTAIKWQGNIKNYDLNIIAGEINESDLTAGFSWAGNIKTIGFKGETMFFKPFNSDSNSNVFEATISLDYLFNNSLYLMTQVLYSDIAKESPIKNFATFYTSNLNAKYLSFTKWNLFGMATYPISPLISSSIAIMYYPEFGGYFINPSMNYSLGENSDFGLFWQYFQGSFPNTITGLKTKQRINMLFLRFKWNF